LSQTKVELQHKIYVLFYYFREIKQQMLEKTKHILINQIKNVGDVILTLPMVGIIRQHYPNAIISFLATQYTKPILSRCPDIAQFLDWGMLQLLSDEKIIAQLRLHNISTIIHLSNDTRIARLAKKAGIPYRIGTCQRLSHWIYCNRWVNQTRRHSHLHDAVLNINMLKPLGIHSSDTFIELANYIHLIPQASLPSSIENLLTKNRFNLIIHPGSNGHGREWPISAFKQLIKQLPQEKYQIFLTGTINEQKRFSSLIKDSHKAINLMGTMTLDEFLTFVSRTDGLVASGTGPLHIAAALGMQTLGLFPPRQGISPRRWHPVGKQAAVLMYHRPLFKCCFSCRESAGCFCMSQITVKQVLDVIQSWSKQVKTT
jgi:heptosyltransferase III